MVIHEECKPAARPNPLVSSPASICRLCGSLQTDPEACFLEHTCPCVAAPMVLAHGTASPSSHVPLYDHLRHAVSAQRLAALERLALESGQRVEYGSNQQYNGS